ncbi:hypothetical protein MASR2M41_14220 [Flammeovirgaceae bacterium]
MIVFGEVRYKYGSSSLTNLIKMDTRTLLIQDGIDPDQLVSFLKKSIAFAKHLQKIRVNGDEIHWLTQELDITSAERFQLAIARIDDD